MPGMDQQKTVRALFPSSKPVGRQTVSLYFFRVKSRHVKYETMSPLTKARLSARQGRQKGVPRGDNPSIGTRTSLVSRPGPRHDSSESRPPGPRHSDFVIGHSSFWLRPCRSFLRRLLQPGQTLSQRSQGRQIVRRPVQVEVRAARPVVLTLEQSVLRDAAVR